MAVVYCQELSPLQARKLDGIGKSIASKIDEYLTTGTVNKLETIRSEDATAVINLLSEVVGIGPAKASDLFHRGIKTIEDLVCAVQNIGSYLNQLFLEGSLCASCQITQTRFLRLISYLVQRERLLGRFRNHI